MNNRLRLRRLEIITAMHLQRPSPNGKSARSGVPTMQRQSQRFFSGIIRESLHTVHIDHITGI